MRCGRYIPGTKTVVDSVWEVRVTQEDWATIQKAAGMCFTTYSWVVRWCVFTALSAPHFEKFCQSVTEFRNSGRSGASTDTHHRLQLCLYGDDEMLLKSIALKLRISVTALIRLALRAFLEKPATRSIGSQSLLHYGIKIMASADIQLECEGEFALIARINFDFFNHIKLWNFINGINSFSRRDESD